jgi:hypothetical protein
MSKMMGRGMALIKLVDGARRLAVGMECAGLRDA